MSIAHDRLNEERKNWRKSRPFGFYARPSVASDGSIDILKWNCGIPGKDKTLWAGGVYPLTLTFTEDYPAKPPKCAFSPPLFHPNGLFYNLFLFYLIVFPSGTVCLSILNEDKDWSPGITIPQILLGIQDLLDNPNLKDPAQEPAYRIYLNDRKAYDARILQQAKENPPSAE